MRFLFVFFIIALAALGCQNDAPEIEQTAEGNFIAATWLYTEYGYSPGSGYFTESVAPVPPQILSFTRDFQIQTNITGLTQFKYYRILDTSAEENPVIAFYREDPGSEPQDISKLEHSYSMERKDNSLKLYYRWCFEGCHLGFKLLSGSSAGD